MTAENAERLARFLRLMGWAVLLAGLTALAIFG